MEFAIDSTITKPTNLIRFVEESNNASDIIENEINKYISQKDKKRIIGHYNCSEIGTCYRAWYWKYKEPIEMSNETKRILHAGNVIHEWIDKVLQNSDEIEVIANEKSFLMFGKNGAVLHGRLDNYIKIKGEEYIVDTKSTKFIGNYPISETYKMQLMPYLKATGIKKGAILQVEKNTLKTKFIEINFSQEILDKVFERMIKIDEYLKNEILPEPEAKLVKEDNWKCGYCDYHDRCKNQ